MSSVRVGVIQMTSGQDIAKNLQATNDLIVDAVGRGAEWVALPEGFAFLAPAGSSLSPAEGLDGEIVSFLRQQARTHKIWLLGGTFPEEAAEGRRYNTSVFVNPAGEICAIYRKIHLFDVDLSDHGGTRFRESENFVPGNEIVLAKTAFGNVGLSICYDVRFPEIYRALTAQGVRFLAVPAAFSPETGRDHWEILLRARAIENQCFVVAPAQIGSGSPGRTSYGRSLVSDPWGQLIAVAPDTVCSLVVDCDLSAQDRTRKMLPALRHRRL